MEVACSSLGLESAKHVAADLHLHVLTEPCTEDTLRSFFSHTLGSPYFDMSRSQQDWDEAFNVVAETPSIWIGEVSWLKAAIAGEEDAYIPGAVAKVSDLVPTTPVELTPGLAEAILAAMREENKTSYSVADTPADCEELAKFLVQHRGQKIFSVSW